MNPASGRRRISEEKVDSGSVRVGLIGTSWWSGFAHASSLAEHPHADVVAVCGRDRDWATGFAEHSGIGSVFGDPYELITSSDLDAVVVALPDDLHHPVTISAIKRGMCTSCARNRRP